MTYSQDWDIAPPLSLLIINEQQSEILNLRYKAIQIIQSAQSRRQHPKLSRTAKIATPPSLPNRAP
jgi:hypothetical protein